MAVGSLLTKSKAYAIIRIVKPKKNMNKFVNPITLAFTFATALGVLAHDTQLDQMTAIAVTAPAALAIYAVADSSKSSEHLHVEKISMNRQLGAFRINVPRTQARDDDRRYIVSKKVVLGSDTNSLWPSV